MSGFAKAGTTAERHRCELRMLANAVGRAPPKRASGEPCFPLTKTYMDVGYTETTPKVVFVLSVPPENLDGAVRKTAAIDTITIHLRLKFHETSVIGYWSKHGKVTQSLHAHRVFNLCFAKTLRNRQKGFLSP
jgi:hypothetical protein